MVGAAVMSRSSCASRNSRARPRTASRPPKPRGWSIRRSDPFDHWLAAEPVQANKLLDCVIERAEERLRRRKEKESAQERGAQAAPARQAGRLHEHRDKAPNSSSSKATPPAAAPSRRATARRRPSCRCAAKSSTSPARRATSSREPADRRSDAGARLRHRRALPRRRSALTQDHHHDRRRRRRRPYRLAADDLLLPGNAETDRRRPPLSRPATALPHHPGSKAHYARDDAQKEELLKTEFNGKQGRYQPLQGPRRNDARALGNDDGPGEAHAAAGGCWQTTARRQPMRSSG